MNLFGKVVIIILDTISHSLLGIIQLKSFDKSDGYSYSFFSVNFYSELVKFLISLSFFMFAKYRGQVNNEYISWKEVFLWTIPALLFDVDANMEFIVMKYLKSAVAVLVFSSLEIVIVGVGSVLILHRHLNGIQWASMFLLCIGVANSELASCPECQHLSDYPLFGSFLAILNAVAAASQGVAIEKLMKRTENLSIWHQGVYLYGFGTLFNLVFVIIAERSNSIKALLFSGYNIWAFILIGFYVAFAMLSNVIIKHINTIVKTIAASSALFVTSILSAIFFSFDMNIPFVLSLFTVCIAIYLYHAMGESDSQPELPVSAEEDTDENTLNEINKKKIKTKKGRGEAYYKVNTVDNSDDGDVDDEELESEENKKKKEKKEKIEKNKYKDKSAKKSEVKSLIKAEDAK